MIQSKKFEIKDSQGIENSLEIEIKGYKDTYNIHFDIERGQEDYQTGGTFGHVNRGQLEEIIDFLDRFVAHKSDSTLTSKFESVMYMEDKSLFKDPAWIKKGELGMRVYENEGFYFLVLDINPNSINSGFNFSINIGSNKKIAKNTRQFLRDYLKKPLNLEKPKDVPEQISNSLERLEIAIEVFYMGNTKEAIAHAREAFEVIERNQAWLKEQVAENKISDLVGSRKQLVSNGLHEENIGEEIEREDAELVLRDVSNMLNYISDSFEK